jgi:hypothetical protein
LLAQNQEQSYSHPIVPGGLLVTSYTTRLTPFTLLMMRVATWPMNFMSNQWKSAVIPSVEGGGAQADRIVADAAVARYVGGLDRQEHGECIGTRSVRQG